MTTLTRIVLLLALLLPVTAEARQPWIAFDRGPGFSVAGNGIAATIVTDPGDHEVVRIAAGDLANDIEAVSGARANAGAPQIWAGTLGRHAAIDRLAATGRLDISKLKGAWESFVITVVERPAPGVPSALIIVGSDRRGTAYGIYEVSRAIGVSPWHWWADVTPIRNPIVRVPPGTHRFGPPSVKYRGIFINDEDWGLEPWAATTFEPEARTIGPKTYQRVFELMLRLKANLLWPAMHEATRAFNADPRNAALADRYAIVMGSSHAEPMLRNNVDEWRGGAAAFNYLINADGVKRYWEARVAANGRYENVYTLGMRGIHDTGMVGPADMAGRRATLERIFADQRVMLDRHVSSAVETVPQVFTPYKEVLDIYEAGLKVPDDVTLMWPDDNFGYIRRLPTDAERRRAGGSGVYYHISYLGKPLSYLWLASTPPALIREEMVRAFDAGADRMWVVNVGDIKPMEMETDYFLSLAWEVDALRDRPVKTFVRDWMAENVDAASAGALAAVTGENYRLNFMRRPEHLQWWWGAMTPRRSPYSIEEADARLAAFDANLAALDKIALGIPPARRDAFFQLVHYPVAAAALTNRRYFSAETNQLLRNPDPADAARRGALARQAESDLQALTRTFNHDLAGGKWRGIMSEEPADQFLPTMRNGRVILPSAEGALPRRNHPGTYHQRPPATPTVIVEADTKVPAGWRRIDGLGRNGAALTIDRTNQKSAAPLRLDVALPPGRWRGIIEVLPTFPDGDGKPLKIMAAVDGAAAAMLSAERQSGSQAWSAGVLDNRLELKLPDQTGGAHRITIAPVAPGVVVDRLRFEKIVE